MAFRSWFLVFTLSLAVGLVSHSSGQSQTVVSTPTATVMPSRVVVTGTAVASAGTVCPKCGRIHAASNAVMPTSATSTVTLASSLSRASQGGTSNVLSTLNAQRSRRGLGTLSYDPSLQAVAERRALQMAASGRKGHPPGSFSPGRYEGVGWSSSFSPSGVSACFTNDPRMRAAGAAMATGRDGVYFCVVYR
ncbi:MAG: CAP domain-containing protein [Planctomycetota bacterium]